MEKTINIVSTPVTGSILTPDDKQISQSKIDKINKWFFTLSASATPLIKSPDPA
jgi:hypothetical protein